MRVLIVGTTGLLGTALAGAAQKQGHEVTALDMGALLEPGRLDVPMLAQDAVVCNLRYCLKGKEVEPAKKPVDIYSELTQNLVRAMRRHNVRRIHCITAVGVGDSRGHGMNGISRFTEREIDRAIQEDRTRQEQIVSTSDRDWLIVRPAKLVPGPARARFGVVRNIRGLHAGTIPAADVAEWTVAQLKTGQNLYRAVVLTE